MLTVATQTGMGLYFRFKTVFPKYLAILHQNHSKQLTFPTYYTIAIQLKIPTEHFIGFKTKGLPTTNPYLYL